MVILNLFYCSQVFCDISISRYIILLTCQLVDFPLDKNVKLYLIACKNTVFKLFVTLKFVILSIYFIMNIFKHGLSPNYIRDLVPPLVQETTSYQLRNANDIQTFATNSELFYNSFFPSSVRAWNALPEDTKQTNSVLAFKSKLNANLRRPPKYYNVGTRQGQVLHARLKMECSSLNSHLYHSKIVDSPSCLCGSFESVHHFLFVCTRFAAARNTHLPRNLHNYSTRDLLFGSETRTDQQNEAIFLQVQDFLIHSSRFNNS